MSIVASPSSSLHELTKKHSAFWQRTNAQPLLHRMDFIGYKPKPYPVSSGGLLVNPAQITPANIDVDRLIGLDQPAKPAHDGNAFNWLGPVYSEAWMEAFIGCPIYAGPFSCSAKPCAVDLCFAAESFDPDAAFNSDWARVAAAVLEKACLSAKDHIAVRQLHLRGVIDMLAAFLGEENLCLALYDNPKPLIELAWKFTDLYLKVARHGLVLRNSWHGGFVSAWNLFAPGPLLDYQLDASNLFPAGVYEKFFLPCDKAILDAFDFSVVHTHACGLHIVEPLLKIDKINVVEISLDRETGKTDLSMILKFAMSIQSARKSLLIYGELDESELEIFIRKLQPNGLAVFYWHSPPKSFNNCETS